MSTSIASGDAARPDLRPAEFVAALRSLGIHRGYWVWEYDRATLRASHPYLGGLTAHLGVAHPDFDEHEGVFFELGKTSGALLFAFVHRTIRGAGAGGVRFWSYETLADVLRDGLRLARGMTRKNALAGLWWGGGKGVIARGTERTARDLALRQAIYSDYGSFITSLRGVYVTAEDAGTTPEDMRQIHERTRFTTCIPPDVGGSGNPSIATAQGVVCGIEAAAEHAGWGSLAGRSVAIQGGGHVGAPLIGYLLEREVSRVVVHDIDPAALEEVRGTFGSAALESRLVTPDDLSLFAEEVDVFAPCALGACLNPRTIPLLRARIVCGAANNQLEDEERDGRELRRRGILYVPDYLTNRMGIVNCADEQYGYVTNDPLFLRHLGRDWDHSIHRLTRLVLARADEHDSHPAHEANQLADAYSRRPHPIWGHRGRAIIESLVADGWSRAE